MPSFVTSVPFKFTASSFLESFQMFEPAVGDTRGHPEVWLNKLAETFEVLQSIVGNRRVCEVQYAELLHAGEVLQPLIE